MDDAVALRHDHQVLHLDGTSQWRIGALLGATEDKAFFVKCDETTMTQDDIDNGRLVCEVGIAPARPAEFVIFQIIPAYR